MLAHCFLLPQKGTLSGAKGIVRAKSRQLQISLLLKGDALIGSRRLAASMAVSFSGTRQYSILILYADWPEDMHPLVHTNSNCANRGHPDDNWRLLRNQWNGAGKD
jgi:hypothetical protein